MKEIRPHIIGVPQAGISKAVYQAALDDAADKQRDLESTQSQLSSTQSQLQTKTQQYNVLRTEYDKFKRQHKYCYDINNRGQIIATRSGMFNDSFSMTKLGLDTSALTDFSNMFRGCKALTEIPPINDTSHVTSMSRAFQNCNLITSVPEMDTSSVTNMYAMFDYCYALESIPTIDTSHATDLSYMYEKCFALTAVPVLDMSACQWIGSCFYACISVREITIINSSKTCKNHTRLFSNCLSLERVNGVVNVESDGKCYYTWDMYKSGGLWGLLYNDVNLRYLVLDGLGKNPECDGATFERAYNWGEGSEENRQSLVDSLLTNSYDRAGAGYTKVCSLSLDTLCIARLTAEEIAAITAKGFTIAERDDKAAADAEVATLWNTYNTTGQL